MTGGRFLLPVVLSATFVQLLNVTIAQIAAPAIQSGLGAGPGAVQLMLAGYTLAYACLLVTAARLGSASVRWSRPARWAGTRAYPGGRGPPSRWPQRPSRASPSPSDSRPDPLIHPSVLRDETARWGVLLVFVFKAGVPSFTYLLFLHLQSALGYPALSAALMSAPFAAAAVLGSRAAPALSRLLGPAVLTAAALVLAGTALALAPLVGTGPGRRAALPVLAAGGAAFGHAMVYEATVFVLTALIALRLRRTGPGPEQSRSRLP